MIMWYNISKMPLNTTADKLIGLARDREKGVSYRIIIITVV